MVTQLTHEEAEQMMGKREMIIADVRDKESYEEEHISNAIHLSVGTMREFCDKADKSQPILVYCYHGVSSQSVAQHLIEQGFSEVFSLVGGFEVWKAHHSASE